MAAMAVVACLAGGIYLATSWHQEIALRNATDAAQAGDYRRAIDQASKVSRAPTLSRALLVRAQAELALGENVAAEASFRRASDAAPNDAEVRRGWAIALTRLGRNGEAGRQLARAVTLDPGLSLPGFAH